MSDNNEKLQLRVSIVEDLQRMGVDELKVVLKFTAGIIKGLAVYGHLDVATDQRNFLAEAQEEGRDRLVYLIAEHLKLEKESNHE